MQENLDHDIIISVIKSQLHELGTAAYTKKQNGNSQITKKLYDTMTHLRLLVIDRSI